MNHEDQRAERVKEEAGRERWWWLPGSSSRRRLGNTLTPYRHQLEQLIARVAPQDAPDRSWATTACVLLDRAEEALRAGRTELGWRYLFEAQRIELQGIAKLGTRAMRARAEALALEADSKLRSWRKTSAAANLKDLDSLTTSDEDVFVVAQVHLLLTEAYSNTYLRVNALRNQFAILIAAVVTALILWFSLADPGTLLDDLTAPGQRLFSSVVLFGVTGAGISGILSLARLSPDLKIPEQITQWYVTVARLAVGGVAALVVYLAMHAGFVELASRSVAVDLVVAFASGFSERLLASAVNKAGG